LAADPAGNLIEQWSGWQRAAQADSGECSKPAERGNGLLYFNCEE
jgi:hypothetical protein